MFLLAYLPIPLPGLKSVSPSKSFTSFSSTNFTVLLIFQLQGGEASRFEIEPCAIL